MQGNPSFPLIESEMTESQEFLAKIAQLPKAELHLHLEGSISPATVSLLGERRGVAISPENAAARYAYSDFAGFLDAFKWATGYLKTPEDYSLIAHRLADELVRQNVIYAEVTLSVGVMLRYGQNVEANFSAIADVGDRYRDRGLRISWIFDATRQFGADAAMRVAVLAAKLQSRGVVAFGIGGDELSVPTVNFRAVYEFAKNQGLHALIHAGEIGGPEIIQESIDLLGAERIGHGIAAMHNAALLERIATLRIPLEVCPTSNLRTGALARQLKKPHAELSDHPLKDFVDKGAVVTLSSDDPAMFNTDLLTEYANAASIGLSEFQIMKIAEAGFSNSFLPPEEKRPLLERFRAVGRKLDLL
jgi:aminodeoxyfutalosine deaminase